MITLWTVQYDVQALGFDNSFTVIFPRTTNTIAPMRWNGRPLALGLRVVMVQISLNPEFFSR